MDSRLAHIRKLLQENNHDALLVSSLPAITHLTDFSYFSNIERDAYLLITKNSQYIFTNGLYTNAVKKLLKNISLVEITTQTPFVTHLKQIIIKENIEILGIEEDDLRVHEYKRIISIVKKTKHVSLSALRITKTAKEIAKIKKACKIGDQAFLYILKQLKPEMTEIQIASLLEIYIKQQGADISFPSIVAFGANAAVPHHKTGKTKLKKNNLILFDFGVKYNNYCSDMTRTIFFGKATAEQKKMYEIVLKAQQSAIQQYNNEAMKQSKFVYAKNLDNTARSYIIEHGYPSIPHSLGHGIGLELHEAPRLSPTSREILFEGMVFSIEPGIYLPDRFGIRIEDLFAIENGKLIQLTKSSQKLIEVEIT